MPLYRPAIKDYFAMKTTPEEQAGLQPVSAAEEVIYETAKSPAEAMRLSGMARGTSQFASGAARQKLIADIARKQEERAIQSHRSWVEGNIAKEQANKLEIARQPQIIRQETALGVEAERTARATQLQQNALSAKTEEAKALYAHQTELERLKGEIAVGRDTANNQAKLDMVREQMANEMDMTVTRLEAARANGDRDASVEISKAIANTITDVASDLAKTTDPEERATLARMLNKAVSGLSGTPTTTEPVATTKITDVNGDGIIDEADKKITALNAAINKGGISEAQMERLIGARDRLMGVYKTQTQLKPKETTE